MILGSFEFCLALWNQWQLRFLDLLSFYLQHGTSRFSTMINKSWNTFWRNYCWYRTMCFQELLWSFACKTQLSCTSSSSIILPDEQTWNQMWSEVWSHSATEIRRGKHEIRCVSVTSAAGAYLYPKSPPAKILYERDTVFVVFPLWLPCIRGYLMHIDAKRFGGFLWSKQLFQSFYFVGIATATWAVTLGRRGKLRLCRVKNPSFLRFQS